MKVMTIGDSPTLNTGFGRVNKIAIDAFHAQGWEVASMGGLLREEPENPPHKIYVPTRHEDVLGIGDIEKAVEDFKPDVLYMTADPGSVTAIAYGTPDMPIFAYIPIEGEPIVHKDWRLVLSAIPAMTCSKYGSKVVKENLGRDIDYVYHGVNHSVFNVNGMRDSVRESMKWSEKFVVICVAANVRRKQITRLIAAISKLKYEHKQKNLVLYLHTVPFQRYWLEGWNLLEIVKLYGVSEEVVFHPALNKMNASIPEATGSAKYPGLAELYNASDLFVLPSQVEGFGLPIAEAMACGVPVMVTKYAAGWEVATPAGRGIPVADWEIHKSGTVYANASVEAMAKEILRLKRSPNDLARMSKAGLSRAQDFSWPTFQERLIPQMEKAIVAFEERDRSEKASDPTEEVKGTKILSAGKGGSKEALQEHQDIIEGSGEDTSSQKAQD